MAGTGQHTAEALELPHFAERESLRTKVAHALRAALVTGKLRPNEVYSAPLLAAKFGVSATPVREAMLDLVKEGLVEPVRNKGFRVTELSEEDLDNITEIRMLIEPPVVAGIAAAVDEPMRARLEELRRVALDIEVFARNGDLLGYIEADRRFHLGLLELYGNPRIVSVVRQLRSQSRLFGLQALADRGELAEFEGGHEQIVDLVLAGDSAGALEWMREHIASVRGAWAGREPASGPGPGQGG